MKIQVREFDAAAMQEAALTEAVLVYVQAEHGSASARVVAGALMRASVAIATQVSGPAHAGQACRQALDNVLIHLEPWRLQ